MRDPRTQLFAVKRVYFSIVRPQNGISLRIIRNALILHYRSRVQHGTPAAFSTTFLGSLTDDPGNDRCSMFPRLRLRIFPYFPSRCGPKSNIREKCRNTSGIHNVSRQKRRINSPINPVYVYIHSTSITDPLLANKTSSRSAVLFPPPSLPAETPPFPSRGYRGARMHLPRITYPTDARHPGGGCKQPKSGINLHCIQTHHHLRKKKAGSGLDVITN